MRAVVHRFFIALAIFGLAANAIGFGYLIFNVVRMIARLI